MINTKKLKNKKMNHDKQTLQFGINLGDGHRCQYHAKQTGLELPEMGWRVAHCIDCLDEQRK